MENVETVPVILLAEEVGAFLEFVDIVHDSWCIRSLEGQRAGQDHWEVGLLESLAEWMSSLGEGFESLARVTEVKIVVWQLRGRANNNDFKSVDGDSFLNSSVQNWVLKLWVAADEDEEISFVDAGNSGVHQVLASEISIKVWGVVSDVEVIRIESVHEISEGKDGLDIGELADFTLNLITWDGLKLLGSEFHGFFPSQLSERAIFLSGERNGESLLLKTVEGMSRLVADPFFIDLLVDSWENSQEVGASGVGVDVGAKGVHDVDGVGGFEFPWSSLEGVWQVVEGADWAEIDNVSRQLVGDHLLDVGGDLIDLSSTNLTEGELTSDLLGESNTSGAMDASGHRGLDERTNILVLNSPLVLSHSALLITINLGDILQIALTALIANWAVEGMVSQKEFHNTASGDPSLLGSGNDFQIWSNLGGARSQWLWRALNFDEAHSAVSSHRKALVIAKSGNFNSCLSACLINGIGSIDANWLAININIELLIHSIGRSEKSLVHLHKTKLL